MRCTPLNSGTIPMGIFSINKNRFCESARKDATTATCASCFDYSMCFIVDTIVVRIKGFDEC